MGNHRRSLALMSAVCTFALLLSACTSDAQPSSPTGRPTFPIRSASGSPSPGAELTTATAQEKCTITTQAAVARRFGTKKVSEVVGVTGIGNPTCRFTLTSSNVGAAGVVAVSLATKTSGTEFVRVQQQTHGAVSIADLGQRAYYVPSTATLQVFKNGKRVVFQATLRVPGSAPPKPGVLRADLVRLARSVAAGL